MVTRGQKNDDDRREWHLDKTFSISHLISTIAGITMAAVLISKMDTRITVMEQMAAAQHAIDARQDADIAESRRAIKDDLREIGNKVDRIAERLPQVTK